VSIVRHTEADAFLAAAEAMLARNAAVRSFANAIADGWRHDPAAFLRNAYVATYARGSDLGLAVRRSGGPLLLENSAAGAARAFADDVAGVLGADLAAVNGEAEPCEAFAERWNVRFGTTHRQAVHMRHHVLTVANPVAHAAGTYRIADARDGEWLEPRALAFAREVGLVDSPEKVIDGIRKRLARGQLRVWETADMPLAFAGWSSAGADFARIAPVYTEPFARGRGCASALVGTLVHELLAAGRRAIFLLTDVGNPVSNAIYARIGFSPVSDTYRYDFVPGAGPTA
jgi:predicted GNAT family acetyltransferase